MFARETYIQRRERLRTQVQSGLILLPGNDESPMNYAANTYPFRQDSTFLYYFGLDQPHLAAVIDADDGTECVFGDDPTVEEIVWTGPVSLLRDRCQLAGVAQTAPSDELQQVVQKAVRQGRTIHFPPQYRAENVLRMNRLWSPAPPPGPSVSLIRAIVQQRSIKSPEEIEQVEAALKISRQMHIMAMRMARPGRIEREVAGTMEDLALSSGVRLAFPPIFSVHGETMHNPHYNNALGAGDIAVNDSGAESPLHYASDITRTIPVGGRFSSRQREVYSIVLEAQKRALRMARPGVEWREVHRLTAVTLMEGLKELGLVKGNPQEAVAAGAHTMFFPCGVGHMMGLDVHDMEPLGEDHVGYTDTIRRNPEFGWRYLRLAKTIEPGFVITVEPGIYFIPPLVDQWRAESRCSRFINYDKVETYRDFHGVRVEDNIVVTAEDCRVLGQPIPKTIEEVEALASM
ncbi:MAG: aminopeptidase P family protein [Sedimentisphaerales bacterium]|nr:aminopeptidase P family protein [Sedimentisphaerales bacterium]